jgi:8-oxo-dGTP diphosphatase
MLLLVRHAHAGDREAWEGDDRLRPLSATGWAQAENLVPLLAPYPIHRVVSSDAVRCIQTVAPLARTWELTVEGRGELYENQGRVAVEYVRALVGTSAAVCTHGDVVPLVLEALAADGVAVDADRRWAKASTWVLHSADGAFTRASYLAPPGKE